MHVSIILTYLSIKMSIKQVQFLFEYEIRSFFLFMLVYFDIRFRKNSRRHSRIESISLYFYKILLHVLDYCDICF